MGRITDKKKTKGKQHSAFKYPKFVKNNYGY